MYFTVFASHSNQKPMKYTDSSSNLVQQILIMRDDNFSRFREIQVKIHWVSFVGSQSFQLSMLQVLTLVDYRSPTLTLYTLQESHGHPQHSIVVPCPPSPQHTVRVLCPPSTYYRSPIFTLHTLQKSHGHAVHTIVAPYPPFPQHTIGVPCSP